MSNSTLTSRDLAMIKRIAMNVDADYQKVQKIQAKIDALQEELSSLNQNIDEMEAPVIRRTNGYKSTDLYEKVVTPLFNEDGSVKTDKNGHPMKATKYNLRYPNTIVPPEDLSVVPQQEEVVTENFNENQGEGFQA